MREVNGPASLDNYYFADNNADHQNHICQGAAPIVGQPELTASIRSTSHLHGRFLLRLRRLRRLLAT